MFADNTLDFFDHLSLELVLDCLHLDIEGRNWLWTHELLNSLVGRDKIKSLIDAETIFFTVHFLEDWVHSSLLVVKLLDWHFLYLKYLLY